MRAKKGTLTEHQENAQAQTQDRGKILEVDTSLEQAIVHHLAKYTQYILIRLFSEEWYHLYTHN